jgi:two-component sensor histidine kinase
MSDLCRLIWCALIGLFRLRAALQAENLIGHLCGALSEALLKPLGIRCEVSVDAGEFPGERCERLGLVIAELVTNSAKHAFHGRNDRLVRVELVNRVDSWVCQCPPLPTSMV